MQGVPVIGKHLKNRLALTSTFLITILIVPYSLYQKYSQSSNKIELDNREVKSLIKRDIVAPIQIDGGHFDFRNVKWSMNINQVKAAESKNNFSQVSSDYLSGYIYVQGLYANLGYTFKHGRLVEANLAL